MHPRAAHRGRDRRTHVADEMSADEIVDAYPDLELDDVREAMRYAAEAVREHELPLAAAG